MVGRIFDRAGGAGERLQAPKAKLGVAEAFCFFHRERGMPCFASGK